MKEWMIRVEMGLVDGEKTRVAIRSSDLILASRRIFKEREKFLENLIQRKKGRKRKNRGGFQRNSYCNSIVQPLINSFDLI